MLQTVVLVFTFLCPAQPPLQKRTQSVYFDRNCEAKTTTVVRRGLQDAEQAYFPTSNAYVVRDVEAHVHVHGLVVDVVLDRLLARRERRADLLLSVAVRRRRQLGRELRLQRPATGIVTRR